LPRFRERLETVQLSSRTVDVSPGVDEVSPSLSRELPSGTVELSAPGRIEPPTPRPRVTPPAQRLRCRAHNQYSAERTFGAEFTKHKRERRPASPARQCGAGGLATSPAAG